MGKKVAKNPVVYFDTSLVIDYLLANGREPEVTYISFPEPHFEKERRIYWEKFFRDDDRYRFAIRLRSIIGWNLPEARVVISPFVLLELDEWFAEETFKREALEGTYVKDIQTQSRKEIGKFIQQLFRDAKRSGNRSGYAKHLWGAMANYGRGENLAGIIIQPVDKLRFDAAAFRKVSLLSYMQMGMADIVHLLAADALKCTHFASKDSDFNRLRPEIERSFRFKVLFKDEVFGVVTSGNPAPAGKEKAQKRKRLTLRFEKSEPLIIDGQGGTL